MIVGNIDTSLIDMEDLLLKQVIADYSLAICAAKDLHGNMQSVIGAICSAYVVGRMRGRKESMLKEMLGENDEKDCLELKE